MRGFRWMALAFCSTIQECQSLHDMPTEAVAQRYASYSCMHMCALVRASQACPGGCAIDVRVGSGDETCKAPRSNVSARVGGSALAVGRHAEFFLCTLIKVGLQCALRLCS
jgi:hypothetical protein